MQVPLFLLHTVLVPGQRLPLKVFEARYLDMVSERLKNEKPFGVCLIKSGHEVGAAGEPHTVGTLARIEQWDMPKPGVLLIETRGTGRFAIRSLTKHGELLSAEIEPWPDEPKLEIPARYAGLVKFLEEVLKERSDATPENFRDASWVGWQFAALLPATNQTRQRWLEQRDPILRLADIHAELEKLARDQAE